MEEQYPPRGNSRDGRPMVEAPLESPLNLAHTFSRRADMLTKSRKYEEAISCHRKAAEYLLQAMEAATSSTPIALLESMTLQHKAYLSEIYRLQCKNQLLEMMDKTDKTTATISQATQTDSIHCLDTIEQVSMDEDLIYELLRESDNLVKKLNCAKQNEKNEKRGDDSIIDNSSGCNDLTHGGTSTVHEVVKINEKLSQAVRSLLQELGSTKAEKRQMEEKFCDSQEILRNGGEGELTFCSLNLPPLEVSYPELAMLKMDP